MFAQDDKEPDDELTKYVIDHYGRFFTELEKRALRILHLSQKADCGHNALMQRKVAEVAELQPDAEVQEIVALGEAAARRKIRERFLRDHRGEIFLNYCPSCSALCRTPHAKMCVRCGHSWHNLPLVPEQICKPRDEE